MTPRVADNHVGVGFYMTPEEGRALAKQLVEACDKADAENATINNQPGDAP
jgi:hypothetical protein